MTEINTSIIWRGQVLHAISLLEVVLNMYISKNFCNGDLDKNYEMILLILGDDRMGLGAKAQVFYGIAPFKHKEWYNTYKSIRIADKGKKPYSMNSDLVWAIEQRNIFAHRIISFDTVYNQKEENRAAEFIQFKNQKNPILYNQENVNLLLNTVEQLRRHFHLFL